MPDLREQFRATVTRHWVSMRDHGGPTPALLGELVAVAEDFTAAAVRGDRAIRPTATEPPAPAAPPPPARRTAPRAGARKAGTTQRRTGRPGAAK
jgi:hypothetical protein